MFDKQYLISAIGKNNYENLFNLVADLRRRKIVGSYLVSIKTLEFFQILISSARWKTPEESISVIHKLGNILVEAQPLELCVGNITRRILFFIREAKAILSKKQSLPPLQGFLTSSSTIDVSCIQSVEFKNIKPLVQTEISELEDELNPYKKIDESKNDKPVYDQNICKHALEQIHANEIIMTYGHSNTVVNFFKAAAKKLKYHIIIPESAPSYCGKLTAKELAGAGIDSTLISDSAIFCMMSRVNKVIIGTHAVLANGGLLTMSGVRTLAEAAKYYSVPFVVISKMYKLSPVYPSEKDIFASMTSPGEIISFKELDTIGKNNPAGISVLNPGFDYIPPELISLYLTNNGVHNPSYIYRMLAEYYNLKDYTFSSKYDEDIIQIKNILTLRDNEVAEALDCFFELNPTFDVNQKIEDNTLLEIACERNDVEILNVLLNQRKINVNDKMAIKILYENKHKEVAKILCNHSKFKMDSIPNDYIDFILSLTQ